MSIVLFAAFVVKQKLHLTVTTLPLPPPPLVDALGGATVAWGAVYLCGLLPNALMNTLQQLFFLRVDPFGEGNITPHDETKTFLRALLTAQALF